MAKMHEELSILEKDGFLPTENFLNPKRFIVPYKNENEFWDGALANLIIPFLSGVQAIGQALQAVWSTFRIIGNLLILEPTHAKKALSDLSVHIALSLSLAVMIPIHAIISSIEFATRFIATWFVSKESTKDLSTLSIEEKFIEEKKYFDEHLLPVSKKYLQSFKFFEPYDSLGDFGQDLTLVVARPIASFFESLIFTGYAFNDLYKCVANLLICRPKHAFDAFVDLGVHLSLALALALVVPVNAAIGAMAPFTRLGSTCHVASQTEAPVNPPRTLIISCDLCTLDGVFCHQGFQKAFVLNNPPPIILCSTFICSDRYNYI